VKGWNLGKIKLDWAKIAGWYLDYLRSIYPEPSIRGHRRGTKEVSYRHPNHASAGLTKDGWLWLAEEAGWKFIDEQYLSFQVEERLFFRK